jgi:hypothetical protein
MRARAAGAIFVVSVVVIVAGAAAVSGMEPAGTNIALNGSDTLFAATIDVLTSCGVSFSDFGAQAISYAGGGSDLGGSQMLLDRQRIAPMHRTLASGEVCGADQATTEGLMLGLDGIDVLANTAATCANTGALAGVANDLAHDSLATLRLIYFGLDSGGAFDCNGPARRALIGSWSSLFATNCPAGNAQCTTGLRHAFRRADEMEVTTAFVSLVGAGGRGIGNNVAAGLAALRRQNPFCNSQDANPTTAVMCGATLPCPTCFSCNAPADPTNSGRCVLSDAGQSDYADVDPIRIPCSSLEAVCEPSGSLGLVLPIYYSPDVVRFGVADYFPPVDCDAGACDLQAPARPLPNCFACPDGQPAVLGRCWHPTHTDPVTHAVTFQCRNLRGSRCFGAASADGRSYNKALIKPDTARSLPAAYGVDPSGRLMTGAFYRLRSTPTDPARCVTATDDDTQIGCLTDADPCTVGLTDRAFVPGGLKALGINGAFPDNVRLIDLLPLSQQVTQGDGRPGYQLGHRVYLNSLKGLGALAGGEAELTRCFSDSAITKAAMVARNFVPIPAGVQCLDYDESPDTARGAINATTIGTGGCPGVPAGGNANACAGAGAPITGPNRDDVQAILSTCVGCHNAATPHGVDLTNGARGAINAPSVECPSKLEVAPSSSTQSYLIAKLMGSDPTGGCFSGTLMPPGGPPLPPASIAAVAAWIDHGALHPFP